MVFIIASLVGGWLLYVVSGLVAVKYLGMSIGAAKYLSIILVVIYAFIVIKAKINSSRARGRRRSVDIFCAKCDQYLGTADSYDMPCPRCGSNRYRRG